MGFGLPISAIPDIDSFVAIARKSGASYVSERELRRQAQKAMAAYCKRYRDHWDHVCCPKAWTSISENDTDGLDSESDSDEEASEEGNDFCADDPSSARSTSSAAEVRR